MYVIYIAVCGSYHIAQLIHADTSQLYLIKVRRRAAPRHTWICAFVK